jgi:hypothetical protein
VRERERQEQRERDRNKERETGTERERQRERETFPSNSSPIEKNVQIDISFFVIAFFERKREIEKRERER